MAMVGVEVGTGVRVAVAVGCIVGVQVGGNVREAMGVEEAGVIDTTGR